MGITPTIPGPATDTVVRRLAVAASGGIAAAGISPKGRTANAARTPRMNHGTSVATVPTDPSRPKSGGAFRGGRRPRPSP